MQTFTITVVIGRTEKDITIKATSIGDAVVIAEMEYPDACGFIF